MKRLFVPVLLAATVAGPGIAFATDVTGTIREVETAKHAVVLETGRRYLFEASSDLSKFTAGEKVTITYTNEKDGRHASAIAAAS